MNIFAIIAILVLAILVVLIILVILVVLIVNIILVVNVDKVIPLIVKIFRSDCFSPCLMIALCCVQSKINEQELFMRPMIDPNAFVFFLASTLHMHLYLVSAHRTQLQVCKRFEVNPVNKVSESFCCG
jgi:hypothetical protein